MTRESSTIWGESPSLASWSLEEFSDAPTLIRKLPQRDDAAAPLMTAPPGPRATRTPVRAISGSRATESILERPQHPAEAKADPRWASFLVAFLGVLIGGGLALFFLHTIFPYL